MRTYKLFEDKFESETKNSRIIGLIFFSIVCMIVPFLFYRNRDFDTPTVIALVITIIAIGFALLRGMKNSKKMQLEQWITYEFILDDYKIIRKQIRTPDIQIMRNEITKIQITPKGGILVLADGKNKIIHIPKYLDGFEEVRSKLSEWSAVENQSKPAIWKSSILWKSLAYLAGFIVFIASHNFLVVLPVSVGLIILFLWDLFEMWRSPQIDKKIKSGVLFGIVIILFVIGTKVYTLLMY